MTGLFWEGPGVGSEVAGTAISRRFESRLPLVPACELSRRLMIAILEFPLSKR